MILKAVVLHEDEAKLGNSIKILRKLLPRMIYKVYFIVSHKLAKLLHLKDSVIPSEKILLLLWN